MASPSKQPVPEETRCPECGERPTTESLAEHTLSAVGYVHDDIRLYCSNEHSWTCGVPIGDDEMAEDDLYCASCESTYMMVHRVHAHDNGELKIHLKCPNCFYFDTTERHPDDTGLALMGYPPITGSRENATPYGWAPRTPHSDSDADDADADADTDTDE